MNTAANNTVDRKGPGRLRDYLLYGGPAILAGLLWLAFEVQGAVSPALGMVCTIATDPVTKACSASIPPWASFMLVALVYLVVALTIYVVRARFFAKPSNEIHRLTDINQRARRAQHLSNLAVEQIINGIHELDIPRARFRQIVGNYDIEVDGTGTVEILYEIEAAENMFYWRFNIDADTTADPIEWLDQIDLKVEALDPGKQVRFLECGSSNAKNKKIAIFFLPEVAPGDTRRVRISYRWPRLANDLVLQGKTSFAHSFRSYDPADSAKVCYRYLFDARIGKLDLQLARKSDPSDSWTDISAARKFGWEFNNDNRSVAKRPLEFAVVRQD